MPKHTTSADRLREAIRTGTPHLRAWLDTPRPTPTAQAAGTLRTTRHLAAQVIAGEFAGCTPSLRAEVLAALGCWPADETCRRAAGLLKEAVR